MTVTGMALPKHDPGASPQRYRLRQMTLRAMRWDGSPSWPAWRSDPAAVLTTDPSGGNPQLMVLIKGDRQDVAVGDWVVKPDGGELGIVKAGTFEQLYEPVESELAVSGPPTPTGALGRLPSGDLGWVRITEEKHVFAYDEAANAKLDRLLARVEPRLDGERRVFVHESWEDAEAMRPAAVSRAERLAQAQTLLIELATDYEQVRREDQQQVGGPVLRALDALYLPWRRAVWLLRYGVESPGQTGDAGRQGGSSP